MGLALGTQAGGERGGRYKLAHSNSLWAAGETGGYYDRLRRIIGIPRLKLPHNLAVTKDGDIRPILFGGPSVIPHE